MRFQGGSMKKAFGWPARTLRVFALLGLAVLGPISMRAQVTTAEVNGTLTDQTGGILPKAKVEIRLHAALSWKLRRLGYLVWLHDFRDPHHSCGWRPCAR